MALFVHEPGALETWMSRTRLSRFHGLPGQIAVLDIAFQQPPTFQETSDAVRDGVRQVGKLSARRRLHPAKPGARSIGAIDVEPRVEQFGSARQSSLSFSNQS